MKVITTHLAADFDAFAAAVCAPRLYPDHRVLFPGSQELAVRRFLAGTNWPFPEVRLREARRVTWEHAVVVDTRNPRRLGEAWELIQRDGCPVTLIDHHATEPEQLGAREIISRRVGATCTILATLMDDRDLPPSPAEASLMLMGIYEDTGGLSYRETTPEDLRRAAWLMDRGGSLELVRRWVLKGLEPEQLDLLNRLVDATEEVTVHGVPVSLAMVEVDRYHEEAAYVVHRWMETFDIPVGVVLLIQPPHVNLILRSRLPGLHAGRVAQHFGGGGHAPAASARVSGRMPVELREELLVVLERELPPAATAADVAVRRIFTIDSGTSAARVKERMNELRVNALPARDAASGALVGLLTRQVLDRALALGLGDRPAEAVMLPGVPTVDSGTPLDELRDLFLERSLRFVVVEEDGHPMGIVTRMELFRRIFERQSSAGEGLDNRMRGARQVTHPVTRMLREVAPRWVQDLIGVARRAADAQEVDVYLVGGLVRDLLLTRINEDVDLVVEGDGIAFAERLAAAAGGTSHPHVPFLTAIVTLPDGHRVDVASARTEFYRTPAALPEVETSLIRQDLYRRDFTVNALAVAISGTRHGQLVDFFGGQKDLQRGEIRVLHSLSFIDDPTRAIRAVRYARRLGFAIAPDTRHLIATAVGEGVFARLSGQRLRRELEQMLAEPHPAPSLSMLADLELLAAITPGLTWCAAAAGLLLEVEGQLNWYVVEELGPPVDALVLFLGALTLCADDGVAAALADRLALAGARRELLAGLPAVVAELLRTAQEETARSAVVRTVERHSAEAALVAMARADLAVRRRLADAMTASVRVKPPVAGRDLLAAGVPPGPHVGVALRKTRDALVDGEVTPAEAREFAANAAREEMAAGQGGAPC